MNNEINKVINKIICMHVKWKRFKIKRNALDYEKDIDKTFLTMNDRENMLDKLFDLILNVKTE